MDPDSMGRCFVCTIALLFVLGNTNAANDVVVPDQTVEKYQVTENGLICNIDDIQELVSQEVLCPIQEGKNVQHMDMCQIVAVNTTITLEYICEDGQWVLVGTDTGLVLSRQRRFFWFAFALAAVAISVVAVAVYCAVDDEHCTPGVQYVANNPPTYTNCPPSDLNPVGVPYVAEKGNDYKVVTWSDPVATDDHGLESNDVTGNKRSGNKFAGSVEGTPHSIIYKAVDEHEAETYCQFEFTVKYIACSRLARPDNAGMSCSTNKDLYGTVCTITCDSGYELNPQGGGVVECQESGQWTTPPTCERIHCPVLQHPDNGYLDCSQGNEYRLGDRCVTFCHAGFTPDNDKLRDTVCQADKTWSVAPGTVKCIDADPPRISCVSPQTFYADRGITSTIVTWVEPTANDTVDSTPTITRVSGPQQGAELSVGEHIATYRATDANGNTDPNLSECNTTIIVEVVSCEHPSDTLETTSSTQGVFMEYNCTKESFYHGVECTLGCRLNVVLNGSDTMTCERNDTGPVPTGYWYWASDNRPFCNIVDCPPLDPPIRGAMVSDSTNARPIRIMLCQEGFDVSSVTSPTGSTFTGQLQCLDSGIWFPLQEFPDCIKSIIPNFHLLNELLYYDGNCNDENVRAIIKQKVLSFLETVQPDIYQSLCPSGMTCKTDNLQVACGASSRRRRNAEQSIQSLSKRATSDVTIVTWDIVLPFDVGNGTLGDTFYGLLALAGDISDEFGKAVTDGKFNIDGYTLKTDSFQKDASGTLGCKPGHKMDALECKPCPSGTFLNATSGDCEYCHVGEYMDHDGAVECDVCPVGYSTLLTGSKDIAGCLKLCDAGFYSPTTMSPCSPCPVGTYQSTSGMTSCVSCPADMTTRSTNSTSADACSLFDLQVKGVTKRQMLVTLTPPTGDTITIAFWTKPTSPSAPDVQLTLSTGSHTILTLQLKGDISLKVGTAVSESHNFPNEIWSHVICVVNTATGAVDLYVNGEQSPVVITANVVQAGALLAFDIQSNSIHGLYLSRITFHSRAPSSAEINTLSDSCTGTFADTIVTMEQMKNPAIEGVTKVTPSACDAVDGCKDQPCGNHTCIDEWNGFTCVCSGGWSGVTCAVAPDYCKDNLCHHGDCVPGNGLYTCSCRDGYTGVFCDTPPVDGSWSDWLGWSTCTTSCDGGTRNRTRSCDNPAPGPHGADCQGDSVQTEACNTDICPSCDPLHRASGTTVTCTDDTIAALTRCNMTCIRGRFLPNGQRPYKEYTCGADTDYSWSPTGVLPECAVAIPPPFLTTSATVQYGQNIPVASQQSFMDTATGNLPNLNCAGSGTCSQTVAISSTGNRRRRSTGSTLTITLEIKLTQTGGLDWDAAYDSGTLSPQLQEMIDAYNDTKILQDAINSSSAAMFNLQVGGVQYTMAVDGVNSEVRVYCPSGHAGSDGLCVPCPAGTRLEAGACVECAKGTYQPDTAQDACVNCPSGYTTTYLGSTDVSQCSVPTTATTVTDPTSSNTVSPSNIVNQHDSDDDSGFQHWMIAACTTVAVFVLCGVIAVCLYRHIFRNNARYVRRGSRVSASHIALTEVQTVDKRTEAQKMEQLDMENEDKRFGPEHGPSVRNMRFQPSRVIGQRQPPSYESHGFSKWNMTHHI